MQSHPLRYDIQTHAGLTALHLAASNANLSVLQILWSKMDQNFMYEGDKFGYTPVHRAAKHGHIHILEFLFNLHFFVKIMLPVSISFSI